MSVNIYSFDGYHEAENYNNPASLTGNATHIAIVWRSSLKIMNKGTLCEECIARGRYSLTNLKIDLREIKRELTERKNIMASEFQELSDKQSELLKIIFSGDVKCTCQIQ